MTGPARRRPGGTSPLLPAVETIRTTPHLDDDPSTAAPAETATPALSLMDAQPQTQAAEPAPASVSAPTPSFEPSLPPAPAAQPTTLNAPSMSPHGNYPAELDERKQSTLNLRRILKARAETVVLRTGGFEGGYNSWNAFVEGALERELQRMADEFNNGEPFPPNAGGFRQGRPLGS